MTAVILILVIAFIIIIAISNGNKKKEHRSTYSTESNQQIKVNVSFPNPEKANDYKFLKFVQHESKLTLEPIYKEMKSRGMKLKPEFETAIQTKIKTGEFKNPYNFKEYFGNKFDLIGIQFLKGTDNLLSAFQIGVCFIKDDSIADSDTYNFCPPKQIVETKKFQNSLELFDISLEFIEDFSFKDVWEIFELRDSFNANLVVCWDEESKILEKIIDSNKIYDYCIKYIKIKEIAQDNKLPDLIDTLLRHFDSDFTIKDDLSLIVSSLAIELRDSGIKLENYIHNLAISKEDIKPIQELSQLRQAERKANMDFVAIDVETAIGKRWSICQIGLAIVENGELKETVNELIQPPNNEYSIWNTKVHGITADKTSDKPTFPEIWEKIYPLIENKKLVAHNAEFDINCLHQTLDYYNIEIPNFDCDCTYIKTGQKLNDACASFNISLDNHHDACCDAEACARLYLKVLDGNKPDFSNITLKSKSKTRTKQQLSNFDGHERIQGDSLKPDLENADKNSPFYSKKVVITGVFYNIDRLSIARIAKEMGADVDTNITKRTNFVIVGADPGPSKMEKVNRYNSEGCNITTLTEKDFLELIEKK